ncbi:hypothetical protein ACH5RR_033654 [Cinchona calisaya]|uniref:RNase H type-1 domain-containing protein n=1 Tax=Cinchona calisaya TaxID=153742 RepID=A0ABD2Y9X6_9GENT
MVEALALLHGFKLCQTRQLSHVEIETESIDIHCAIIGANRIPWAADPVIRQIRSLLMQNNHSISHVYHEANTVVDLLAKLGNSSSHIDVFFDVSTIPSFVDGYLKMNMLGVSSIRH